MQTPCSQDGLCLSERTMLILTFEQLINISAGRHLDVPKAHQRTARKRQTVLKLTLKNN